MKWISALLPLLLFAGDFWNEKDPSSWTPAEKQQLLNHSPWAKPAQSQIHQKQARNRSGRVLWEMRSGAPPPMEGMSGTGVTVRWESAAPLRAVLPPDELERYKEYYVLSVSGLPVDPPESSQESQDGLIESAILRVKGKDPVRPEALANITRKLEGKQQQVLIFYFPRTYGIESSDKEVLFQFSMGPIQIETVFYPREMQFQGKFSE